MTLAPEGGKKIIILYILKILRDYTDGDHPMTQAQIAEKLSAWAEKAEGVLLRTERDRYLFLIEEKDYEKFIEDKGEHSTYTSKLASIFNGRQSYGAMNGQSTADYLWGIENKIMSSARRERTAISCASAERSAASHSPRAIDAPKQLWIVRENARSSVVRLRSSGSGTP